ncbi:MAG: EamA family transporter RarD, partial [Hyphomonadaceae bacterium]
MDKSADAQFRQGFILAAAANFFWGLLPVYLKMAEFAQAAEVLAQRILWSIPCALIAVLAISGARTGFAQIRAACTPKMLGMLTLSAAFIFINWGGYVWAAAHGRLMEASLAYFIAPMVQVAIGVFLFHEKTTPLQIVALALATLGVGVQAVMLGTLPWLSLVMCASWCAYAAVRKIAVVPASVGMLVETTILVPPAAALLVWTASSAPLGFMQSTGHAALLALAGPVTAIPLILFAFGARRIPFSIIGLLQFIPPSMQFLLSLFYGEAFTPARAVSFSLIWLGLVFFSFDLFT